MEWNGLENWDTEIQTRRHEFYNGVLFISLASPPQECWDPPSLLRPVKQMQISPLTGQQIADFFSLKPGTKTFQEFIKEELEFNTKWRNRKR